MQTADLPIGTKQTAVLPICAKTLLLLHYNYFEDRLLSSDSESEVEKTPEEDNIVNVSDNSLLKYIPNLDELSEESVSTTKGSNLIVSLFHHHLENNSFGEDTMFIHADNCVGQNKNNILMGYLAWRICHNKNKKICLSFMPVGHTKFACDWAFGLFKKTFRNTYVSSMSDLVDCVKKSTPTTHVNSGVVVGNEKGEVAVPVYDWLSFLQKSGANKVPHVTQYNHFEFNSLYKGKVHCKIDIDGNEFIHKMFPTEDGPHGFPQEITPEGMTRARKEYLYKNIRQYCKDEFKDVLCPCPEPNAEESTGAVDPDDDGPEAVPGPSKKRRKRSV
ncbi:hypothetical protein J6590_083241 [Homalodisca vitripennis]|nr:hypothetical protein J6590_083241 [Homalodisca vitripennis]